MSSSTENGATSIAAEDLLPIALDIWREANKPDGKALGRAERLIERLHDIGFDFQTYVGQKFDENLKVRVVDHKDAQGARVVQSCLTPAIFFHGNLLKPANVTTSGEK